MRNRLICLAMIAGLGVAACSSEAGGVGVPDPRGAGLATKIVSIVRDSTGYSVQIQTTSQDKGTISFNPACAWRVDAFTGSAWTVLGQSGDCQPVAIGLSPGQSMMFAMHVRAVPSGTVLRVAIGWGINQESMSDPSTVN